MMTYQCRRTLAQQQTHPPPPPQPSLDLASSPEIQYLPTYTAREVRSRARGDLGQTLRSIGPTSKFQLPSPAKKPSLPHLHRTSQPPAYFNPPAEYERERERAVISACYCSVGQPAQAVRRYVHMSSYRLQLTYRRRTHLDPIYITYPGVA